MSDWRPKYEFPDLSACKYIGLDTETYDPNLDSLGPGAMRKDGFLVGISIYTEGFSNYYPIRHEDGGNMPKSQVVKYLKQVLSNPELHVIGTNLIYDLEWLWTEGIEVKGPKHDVSIRDALIDENQREYDLDSISIRNGFPGKDEDLLTRAAAARGWNKPNQVKKNLWRLHSSYVGPYAEADAKLPYEIYFIQQPVIEKLGLQKVDELESKLTDVLFRMWERGVPVDLDNAEIAVKNLNKLYNEEIATLKNITGQMVDVWSGQSLQRAYDAKGIAYPRTAKGNPSFTAEWLEKVAEDEISQHVLRARQFDRSGGVFVESKIVRASVNGRIHPNYKQTKTEDGGGTKSGRLSSSNPNLQQVPARNKELSRIIRSLFLSDTGKFGVFDYSQQEPRIGIHFALLRGLRGAEQAAQEYRDNPRTDYHQFVADMCERVTGNKLPRKDAKTINLGISYGMGGAKLCRGLGLPTEFADIYGRTVEVAGDEGQQILRIYDEAVPFVKLLSKDAMNLAQRRGWVKTILGRRCNFPDKRWAYRAANRIIQGSAADMMKQAMIDLDSAGYLPYNVIHDETDQPIEDIQKDGKAIRDIMLNAVPLEVPLQVDVEVGPNWGSCVEIELEN